MLFASKLDHLLHSFKVGDSYDPFHYGNTNDILRRAAYLLT